MATRKPSGEVHDEMLFHFRELVAERMKAGESFDTAWDNAQQQFGPMRSYENECQAMAIEHRLGWKAISIAGALLVVGLFGWILLDGRARRLNDELRQVHHDIASLDRERQQVPTQPAPTQNVMAQFEPLMVDLVGEVVDEKKNPLADATLLIIHKTWPNGHYQQEDYTAKTDSAGQFVLPKLIQADCQYAIQVAVFKDGFGFESFYHLKQKPIETPSLVKFELQPARQVTLAILNAEGKPIAGAKVMPFARQQANGRKHQVYFQGSDPIHRTTDATGRVQFSCFEMGDGAEIYVQLPGQDWDRREIKIDDPSLKIEIASN